VTSIDWITSAVVSGVEGSVVVAGAVVEAGRAVVVVPKGTDVVVAADSLHAVATINRTSSCFFIPSHLSQETIQPDLRPAGGIAKA
jgi:hypothetical protein